MEGFNKIIRSVFMVVMFIINLFGCDEARLRKSPAGAPIPIPENAKTYKDHAVTQTTYLNRTVLEPYLATGPRKKIWDEQAVAYLERVIANWSVPYNCASEPMTDLITEGEALLALGCDSPMVLFCHSRIVYNFRYSTYQELYPALEKFVIDTDRPGYASIKTFTVPRDLAVSGHPKADEYARIAAERLIKAFGETQYIAGCEEEWIKQVTQTFDNRALIPYREQIFAAAQQVLPADSWMLNTLAGHYHKEKGWDARGSGWASSVTEDGWKIFDEELQKARDAFTAAWQERPDIPLSAVQMITITAADYGNPGDTPRTWFDRCMAANIDCDDAYNDLVWAYTPRWGGSHREMYAFGLACLESDRYDTLVPYNFINAIRSIASDEVGDRDSWYRTGVKRKVKRMIKEYRKAPDSPIRGSYLRSLNAAVDWQYDGRDLNIGDIIDELGADLEEGPFVRFFSVNVDAAKRQVLSTYYNKPRKQKEEKAINALPLRVSIPKPTQSPAKRTSLDHAAAAATYPLHTLVGKTLTDVKKMRGAPTATRKAAGVMVWTYSDGEVESDDGITVSRVHGLRRE